MSAASLMWMLVAVFIAHEFEEMIMLKPWLAKQGSSIKQRFPRLGPRVLMLYERLSPSALALAILEQLLLLVAIVVVCVEQRLYLVWAGLLAAYTLHIVAHLLQWLILRVYCPFVYSSVLSLAFAGYAALQLPALTPLPWLPLLAWSLGMLLLIVLNLRLLHGLAPRFDRWLEQRYLGPGRGGAGGACD
ncbi:HXXEE domain-containing protein [Paucibacter sp. APW11]|uniref:HXXEE domain-containing protein n=1 Tax=Roseateles aquae TaxID=3077235 RepID=A0ABU3PBI3_9BURK|nr:HXXEE domain-containing protein [Paucibacter sp. APW11]MDT8999131.1 HXXEE domain-containing protein [Paucibacter sp. APW11]